MQNNDFIEKIRPMWDEYCERMKPFREREKDFQGDLPVRRGQIRLVPLAEDYKPKHGYESHEGTNYGKNRYILILDNPNDGDDGAVRFMLCSNQGYHSWWTAQEVCIHPVCTDTTFIPFATAVSTDCMGTVMEHYLEGSKVLGEIGQEYFDILGEICFHGWEKADKEILYGPKVEGTVMYPLRLTGPFDWRWDIKANEGEVSNSITMQAYAELVDKGVL